MEAKLMVISFLTNFNIERTDVPLRLHAKFLYEPVEENLVKLTEGGVKLWDWVIYCIYFYWFNKSLKLFNKYISD